MISKFSTSYTRKRLDCRNLIYNKVHLKQELHSKESIVILLVYFSFHAWAGVNTWPTSVCCGKQNASRKDGDAASGIQQEGTLLHHYNHYRRRRTHLPTNGHE